MTNFILPENAIIIHHINHKTHYYQITQGFTHIFKFEIPPGGEVVFKLTHTAAFTQDFTLRGYFSQFPLGESLNLTYADLRWFPFPRVQRVIILRDILFLKPRQNINFAFPAGTYYFNIQNLTNMINGYHLIIEEKDYDETHFGTRHGRHDEVIAIYNNSSPAPNTVNGMQTTFQLPDKFIPGMSVDVFVNDIFQPIQTNYNIINGNVVFNFSPSVTSEVKIRAFFRSRDH